jgi:hypothetical protein
MYIYLRVDIPIHHNAERIVPKFVLVTWQGVDNGLFSDDESGEGWNSLSFSDGPPLSGPPLSSSSLRDTLPPTPSNSIVQRVMTAQKHGSEVTRFFPHHVRDLDSLASRHTVLTPKFAFTGPFLGKFALGNHGRDHSRAGAESSR